MRYSLGHREEAAAKLLSSDFDDSSTRTEIVGRAQFDQQFEGPLTNCHVALHCRS